MADLPCGIVNGKTAIKADSTKMRSFRHKILPVFALLGANWLGVGAVNALAADPVATVVRVVSRQQYETYHLDVENSGLGLYGGPAYYQGFRNRDGWNGPGTPGNQEARLYIGDQFTAMGLSVSVQGPYLNVVGELTGTTTPEKVYIIGAHYDHLAGDMPGGDDNASGTAGVLEAARVLSRFQFESTIRFICFNAEEDGLKGSRDYVAHGIAAGETIVGMINMDMILRPGSDAVPTRDIDFELETNGSLPWAEAYAQAAVDYVPSLAVGDVWDGSDSWSDNDAFQEEGIPSLLVIENSWGDWYEPNPVANSFYHDFEDASDRLANDPGNPSGVTYDYAFATDVVRVGVALLAREAVIVQSDYETWATKFAGADLSDPDADWDEDRLTNNVERIWGLDPTSSSSSNPVGTPLDPATGIFSYTRREPALSAHAYSVWITTDLQEWTEDTGAVQTPGDPIDEVETVLVTLSPGLRTLPRLFFQVRAVMENGPSGP